MFVIDRELRFPQCPPMGFVTHDQIRDALIKALDERRLKGNAVAAMLGIPPSRITDIKKGDRRIQQHEMHILAEFLGLGEAADEDDDESNVVFVPVIGIASAGGWREAINVPVYRIPRLKVKGQNQAFAVEIYGDSMDRIMPHGSWAIIDPDQTALYPGRVYLVMNGDGEATIKRYREGPARFEPDSHNPDHKTILMGGHAVNIIGRVVSHGSDAGL
jgi:SOS-response transcriptional repressor LexA